MNQEILEKLKNEYSEEDDLIQLYEDWGDTPYLHEMFQLLDQRDPDWVLERELGSWAAEFMLDILLEHEEELDSLSATERVNLFQEEINERYDDFRGCHQFARVNNLSMQFDADEENNSEDLDDYIDKDGEKIGFPKY